MKLDGNQSLRAQGNYTSGVAGSAGKATYIKSDSESINAAAQLFGQANALQYQIQQKANATATTAGIAKGEVEYAKILEELKTADPDEAIARYDEWEAGFDEDINSTYTNEDVRDAVKAGLTRTSGMSRLRMLSNTATNMSAKDDAVLEELGNVYFGQAVEGIDSPNFMVSSMAQNKYIDDLEQNMLPEFIKRKDKWPSEEGARLAFNKYAAAKLTEMAELLIDKNDSVWDDTIEGILEGDYIKKYSADPSGIIDKHRTGKLDRVTTNASRNSRSIVGHMKSRLGPTTENLIANFAETAGDYFDGVESDPNLDYSAHAKIFANQISSYVLDNIKEYSTLAEAQLAADTMLGHESLQGVVGIDADALKKQISQGFADKTASIKTEVHSAILKSLADPDVTLTADAVNEILETAGVDGVVPVGVDDAGKHYEMSKEQFAAYLLEDSLGISSTYSTGAADGAEFNALDSAITSRNALSSKIESARTTEATRTSGVKPEEYAMSVIMGVNEDAVVDTAMLSRALEGKAPVTYNAMLDGYAAAGEYVPEHKKQIEQLLTDSPGAAVGKMNIWAKSNPKKFQMHFGDYFDNRVDNWSMLDFISNATVQGDPQASSWAALAEKNPGAMGALVDQANLIATLVGDTITDAQREQLDADSDAFFNPTTSNTIKQNIAMGLRYPAGSTPSPPTVARAAMATTSLLFQKGLSGEAAVKYLTGSQFVADLQKSDAGNGIIVTKAAEADLENNRIPNSAVRRTEGGEEILNDAQRASLANIDPADLMDIYDEEIGSRGGYADYGNAFVISASEAEGYGSFESGYDYIAIPIIGDPNTQNTQGFVIYKSSIDGTLVPATGGVFQKGIVSRDINRTAGPELKELLKDLYLHMSSRSIGEFYAPEEEVNEQDSGTLLLHQYLRM